mmetsp:Transcript_19332/g.40464  ORF Transcript_19332/g.40464 Transcript_19332/m.40464 type:complete len:239 (+) Transcript_19332:117-833(+)
MIAWTNSSQDRKPFCIYDNDFIFHFSVSTSLIVKQIVEMLSLVTLIDIGHKTAKSNVSCTPSTLANIISPFFFSSPVKRNTIRHGIEKIIRCILRVSRLPLQIPNSLIHSIFDILLNPIRRKGTKPTITTKQRSSPNSRSSPNHKQLQIAFVAPPRMKRHTFISADVTSVGGLRNILSGCDIADEVVGIGQAPRQFAKNAGVVPGNSLDSSVFNIDDGSEVGEDLLRCCVVVATEEGD